MKPIQAVAATATDEINKIAGSDLSDEQKKQIANIIDNAVIQAMLEGQHRAVDATLNYSEADEDLTHKIARAIRRKNDVLIANLTSLR
ncbi:MAG TPA: hypothetical protein ENJ55_06360 [Rhizobiales bacterium]|nr:hypothetical protein [Hyphomicrobiales bacterium]